MSGQRWSDREVAKLIPRLETLMEVDPTNVPRDNYLDALLDLRDARAEAARLRAVLIEAQERIDYGTRAGGAAEVLAHIATVLKGEENATALTCPCEGCVAERKRGIEPWDLQREVERMRERGVIATTGREMAVVAAAKALIGQFFPMNSNPEIKKMWSSEYRELHDAVALLLEAEGKGDESWPARRAELIADMSVGKLESFAAALDRAFEFGRGMR